MNAESQPRYLEPTRGTRVFNSAVAGLTRMGISVWGSRVLAVRGRKSGEWRTTPVNPLTLDGERYLIAPRGNTQWVRNMRVAGGGELRVGRRAEPFTATEVAVEDRPRVLRAYLKRWKFEVGMFFQGVGPDSPDDTLLAIAPDHPVFRITDHR
jgi:deazaflavin-dependent oxidoreductase (nitroreductase family)